MTDKTNPSGEAVAASDGTAEAPDGSWPEPDDAARLDADPVRCLDADASKAMQSEIDQAASRISHTLPFVTCVTLSSWRYSTDRMTCFSVSISMRI